MPAPVLPEEIPGVLVQQHRVGLHPEAEVVAVLLDALEDRVLGQQRFGAVEHQLGPGPFRQGTDKKILQTGERFQHFARLHVGAASTGLPG